MSPFNSLFISFLWLFSIFNIRALLYIYTSGIIPKYLCIQCIDWLMDNLAGDVTRNLQFPFCISAAISFNRMHFNCQVTLLLLPCFAISTG